MYHFPIDQYWKPLSNLTIIGDAAHRIPPYAGEGANQALADALDFYETFCFGSFENTEDAVAAYENKMRIRMEEITKDTLMMTDAMHTDTNLQFLTDFFSEAIS